jgi:hypothetical protein
MLGATRTRCVWAGQELTNGVATAKIKLPGVQKYIYFCVRVLTRRHTVVFNVKWHIHIPLFPTTTIFQLSQ